MACRIRYHKIVLEPFQAILYLSTYKDIADNLSMDKLGHDTPSPECMTAWIARDDDRPFCIVMYLSQECLEEGDEALWHEALHVATWLWHHAGAGLHVMYNDEVLTYYQGYVVREVQKALDYQYMLENSHDD